MASYTTIARPYAKALFAFAESRGELLEWAALIKTLAIALSDPRLVKLVDNPNIRREQLKLFLLEFCSEAMKTSYAKLKKNLENFITLLLIKKRLIIIPDIDVLYQKLQAKANNVIGVDITTAYHLNKDQLKVLKHTLEKRLGTKVDMTCYEDDSLIGGIIIRAEDWVINASVKDKLVRLQNSLYC